MNPNFKWGISLAGLILGATGAHAQTVDQEAAEVQQQEGGLETIIVTAERRAVDQQEIPLAITAVTGDALTEQHATNIAQVNVPGLVVSELLGAAKIYIRGIGYDSLSSGAESRVAIYNDGVYIARPPVGLVSFYDVDRIEVLRGPQGTLYGRNATAGAVNIITTEPGDYLEGYGSLTVGNYNTIQTEGAVTVPLSDAVSTRLAFQTIDNSGYGEHIENGKNVDDLQSRAFRAKVAIEPSDTLRVLLTGDYYKADDGSGGFHYAGPAVEGITPLGIATGFEAPEDPRDTAGVGPDRKLQTYGFAGQVDLDLSDNLTLTSLTSYRKTDFEILTNNDGLPSNYSTATQIDDGEQFSEELRIAGDFDRLQFILGGYYFQEKANAVLQVAMSGFIFGVDMEALFGEPPETYIQGYWAGGTLKTKAGAIFGQATYEVTDALKLTVGGRYSSEKKSIDEQAQFDFSRVYDPANPIIPFGTQTDSDSASSFDPKVAIEYKFSEDIFAYASWSRGFKSGGYNVGGLQAPFDPEKITDYEFGIKTDLLDRRLRLNLSAFWYDYTDLQSTVIRNTAQLTENAASAELKGIELEFAAAPIAGLRLAGSFSYLDGKYKDYITEDPTKPGEPAQDLAGNRLSNSPRYLADLDIAYTMPIGSDDLTLQTRARYTSKIYFTQFNNETMSEDGRIIVDGFARYEFRQAGVEIGAFIKNVFDKRYFVTALEGPAWIGFPRDVVYNPPRTFGVELRKTF